MSAIGIYGFAIDPGNTVVSNDAVNPEKDIWKGGGPGRPG
jgi:hypothetical protein